MSKKTLLNENTVRQFMKYANLGGLSDNFINENYMDEDAHVDEGVYEELEAEEDVEEGMAGKAAGKMAGGAAGAALGGSVAGPAGAAIGKKLGSMAGGALGSGVQDKLGLEEEEEDGMAPMGDDMDDEAPMDDMDMADDAPSEELPPEAISALERAVEKAADAMLDALAPFGVEGEASVEGDEAPMDDMGDMGDMGDEAPMDDVDVIDEEEVVQETMKRVMNRLKLMKEGKQAEDKKSDMINSVADAIVARLRTKK
jgi:outer membrane lipoprotein SlyB